LKEGVRFNSHDAVIRDHVARVYYNLGIYLDKQGNTQEAIAAYREAIRLGPQLRYAYYNLGNILEKQGKLEEAIVLLKEAIPIKSHNAVTRENLARLYYKQGIYLNNQGKAQEAIAAHREAIRLAPNYTPPLQCLGSNSHISG
jgi:tetratricopeptide (TPR) repeat protein